MIPLFCPNVWIHGRSKLRAVLQGQRPEKRPKRNPQNVGYTEFRYEWPELKFIPDRK